MKLLRDTASLKEFVGALNTFYDEFLEQNICLNLDFANQEDVNDGEFNKQNMTRVCRLTLLYLILLYITLLYLTILYLLYFRLLFPVLLERAILMI